MSSREPSSSSVAGATVARHAGIVAGFTMLSRVFGLVRDMVFAHLFGATHATDAFVMAFTIPNTFRMLVAEGSLTVAFLPVFNEVDKNRGQGAAALMMRQALGVFPSLTAILTAVAIVFAEPLVLAFAAGYREVPGKFELTVLLTRWMFSFLIMISFVALAMGALNARKRFASSAAAPVLFNLVHVLSMVTLSRVIGPPLLGVAIGVLLGGLAQAALQAWALHREGLLQWPMFTVGPEIRRVLRLMIPAVLALGVYQINILVLRLFASFLGEGAVTILYNADRFLQLPLGVFGISIATAALPHFSDAHETNDHGRLVKAFGDAVRLNNFISIPATVGLAVLAGPIIATVFQHGEFSREMAELTGEALFALALGLIAVSWIRVAGKVFFAVKDFRTPVACSTVGLSANVAFASILANEFGVAGLAGAVSTSAWIQLMVQLWFLRRRLGRLGLARILTSLARDTVAAVPMGAAVLTTAQALGDWTAGTSLRNVGALAVAVLAGLVVFVAIEVALRSPELAMIRGGLGRRLSRRKQSEQT